MINSIANLLVRVAIFAILSFGYCKASVVVTPSAGNCLNNAPGAYTVTSAITIRESLNDDFSAQAAATIILDVPAGFEFLAGAGTVTYLPGSNISAASVVVSSSQITVTYTCLGTNKLDELVISGIQARGVIAGGTGNILRTGGTAVISGDATGAGVNHGTYTSDGTGITATSVADGNWSDAATWSTGIVPACNQNIIISHLVTADMSTTQANVTITSGGNLLTSTSITVTSNFTITGTGTYTHNNSSNAANGIFAGNESFSNASNLVFNQWYNTNVPLGSLVNGNFGNIAFNTPGTWQQDGYFAPARISGNVVINNGTVVMDDGTGMTTALTLNDITIAGTGNFKACLGANRDFTLITGNFTDNGTAGTLSYIKSVCTGTLTWRANGDVTLNDDFTLVSSSGTLSFVEMTVGGDLNITGGDINFLDATNSPFTLTVSGRTTISGRPGFVEFVNSGNGAFIYNTTDLEITAIGTFELIDGSFTGTNEYNITNDLIVNGDSTIVYFLKITNYSGSLDVITGRDISITNSDVYFANSVGDVNLTCGRKFIQSGVWSEVHGQNRTPGPGVVNMTINGDFIISGATFYQTKGEGNISLIIGETFELDNANFFGNKHSTTPAQPTSYFAFQDFLFTGGVVNFFHVKTGSATSVTINCSNNFTINFESDTDKIELVAYDGNNDATLDLYIGGNFSVTGNYPGAYFISSKGGGDETVTVDGNLSVSGNATVFFVCNNYNTSGIDAHNIVTEIGGNLNIDGGTTFLSTRDGSATVNVGGDVILNAGVLNLKWLTGSAIMTIAGNYTQTGGIFNMHLRAANIYDTCKVSVYGDFYQSGGTYNFDYGNGPAEHTLTIYGANYTLDGSAVIKHENNLTTKYTFGQIYFSRPGTTVYSRNSSSHNIQHVKQTIRSGTTVNASASTNGLQMTSVASATTTIHNALTIYGTLDMGDKVLTARQNTNYYSRLTVTGTGRYRTSHTGGLYSGVSTMPGSIDGFISTLNRTSYYLDVNSTVEYYGTSTSVVTGVPNGIATGTDQQYGNLEINFSGTAGSTWVYPETTDEVHIRTALILTEGEFNLDSDHVTTGGGRSINLEAGATATRTNGFIRSETEDGSGVVKWNILTNSSNTIPFGYDVSTYIPFTFQQTSGSAGVVAIGTYRTIPDNSPLPPTVTHVRDVNGVDNSTQTIDRFWNITVPGTTGANLVFTYAPSEGTGIASPRAQLWEPITQGWYPPSGTQSNPTSISTAAAGISMFNSWWTLSALSSPLPVELMEFNVRKDGNSAVINWITQTEVNNNYFTVERSSDGILFESLKIVAGAGNSTSPVSYTIQDENPLSGRNYYRLKQTDYDGYFTYSQTRTVTFGNSGLFHVYPNPVPEGADISIGVPEKGKYDIVINDAMGNLIYKTSLESTDGEKVSLNGSEIPGSGGVCMIMVTGEHFGFSQKIITR